MTATDLTIEQATKEIEEDILQRSMGKIPIEIDKTIYYVDEPVIELIDGLMLQLSSEVSKN